MPALLAPALVVPAWAAACSMLHSDTVPVLILYQSALIRYDISYSQPSFILQIIRISYTLNRGRMSPAPIYIILPILLYIFLKSFFPAMKVRALFRLNPRVEYIAQHYLNTTY